METTPIPSDQWDAHKENIYSLYIQQNMVLNDMIGVMKQDHNFHATKAQYLRQLKKWHMGKNSTNEQWKFAANQIEKRKLEGKRTEILVNGKLVPPKKLKKEVARYAGTRSAASEASAAETGVPSGIIVRTPPADAIGDVEDMNIPQFQCQEHSEANLGHESPGTALIEMRSPVQDWFRTPSPVSFDVAPGMLGPSSPHLTLLSTMNDGGQDSLRNLFGDYLTIDWDTILYTPLPPPLPSDEKSNGEAKVLLGQCLKVFVDPKCPEYDTELSSELESISTQSYGGEVMRYILQLYNNSASDPSFQLLRYAVYLSSNNLLSDDHTDMLLKWVIENNKSWILERLMDAKGPTTEIFASKIFISAVRLGQIGAVLALLAKGVDANVITGGLYERRLAPEANAVIAPYMNRHALHEAIRHRNIRIVQVLLDAGVDPNAEEHFPFTALKTALDMPFLDTALIKLLLSRGADVSRIVSLDYGETLRRAVQLGDPDFVYALLGASPRRTEMVSRWDTALQHAARYGKVEIVEALLKTGADADSCLDKVCYYRAKRWPVSPLASLTPLQIATIKDHTEVVQILLDAGAGVNHFPAAKYFDFPSFCFKGSSDDCQSGFISDSESDYESDTSSSNSNHDYMESDVDDFCSRRCLLTALQAAVSNNNTILVRMFLSHGAEVDAIGARGTALQIAASKPGHFKLVQLLLRNGADVNSPATVPGGRTALQAAAGSGDEQTVELLLRMGANVNAPAYRRGGCTAVQAAARSGNLETVKLLVGAGADVHADAAFVSGRTCLQCAAGKGDINIVDYLLQLGVNINEPACPINGRTALLFAIENHHKSVAERLLEKGADPNELPSGRCGITPLQAAVKNEWYDFAQLLLRQGANPNRNLSSSTPLGISLRNNAVGMVRQLIDAGADVNERCADLDGMTTVPLQLAVSNGSIDIVRNLLDAGARIDGMHGIIPLHLAVAGNSLDIVKLLLFNGVSPNPRPDHDRISVLLKAICRSPINEDMVRVLVDSGARLEADNGVSLCYAVKRGCLQAVKTFLQAGADVNARPWGPHRRTALQEAVIYGNFDIAAALLDRGADINAPLDTERGGTVLQTAAGSGSLRMVQLLLAHGADVNAPAAKSYGATALQAGVIKGHFRIVLILLESGADVNASGTGPLRGTALEAAASHGRLDIMHLLLQKCGDVGDMEAQCRRAAKLASSGGHAVLAKVLREWKRPI